MRALILLIFGAVLFAGCCGISSPQSSSESSSFCQYGTYGQACTNTCQKFRGTQFDGGPTCFSDCTSLVRNQGLGDATTCCRESIRSMCTRVCTEQIDSVIRRYGSEASAEKADMISQCFGECSGAYTQNGISLDSCSVLNAIPTPEEN